MEEIEILKKYLAGKEVSANLKLNIDFWPEGSERQKFIEQKRIVDSQIEILKTELINIKDKRYSLEAKSAIIDQFNAYIREISKERYGLKLSRSQSMSSPNMLFGYIVGDIHHLITDKIYGIHIPAYLLYTHSNENSVETSSLIDFMNQEIRILNQIEDINYISLYDYFNEFRDRIRIKFID